MRLFLLTLAITLLNSFTPVLAAPGDVWLVYRPDEQGRIATTSGERWMDNAPEPGKNVPAGSMVLKFIPEEGDKDPWNYTRQNNRLVHTPPAPPVVAEPEPDPIAELTIKEAAVDARVSDSKFIKMLRENIAADKTVDVKIGL